jgi:hypothetical protein
VKRGGALEDGVPRRAGFEERLGAIGVAVGEGDVQRGVPVAVALVHVHVVVVILGAALVL